MLQSLRVTNIALIDALELSFHSGLHVLSGETGAGKSIVVDAMMLILGGRADRDLIRTGTEKATAEAVFDVPHRSDIAELLTREGLEYDGRTVTIFREIARNGRNICRVCGMLMPLSFLRELAELLMDIHGQQDQRFLLDPKMHLSFLDRMGDEAHQRLLTQTAEDCRAFMVNHRAYAALVKRNERKERRMKELEEALAELREANPREGDADRLQEECERLRREEKIASALRSAYGALATGETEAAPLEKMKLATASLSKLQPLGAEWMEWSQRGENLYYELEDFCFDLHRALEAAENEPGRLEQAEKRLEGIRRLIRSYGSEAEAIQAARRLEEEYAELCGLEDEINRMAWEHKHLLAAYRQQARALGESRRNLATAFEARMREELAQLGMENTLFIAHFQEPTDAKPKMPREDGDDEMEFLISPNPGEPPKPLAKIASGGELSRLMLALKTLEAGHSGIDAMVFDEIDTGISGRMAQVVAEKMITISRSRQVICVTHLPQIAAAADHEYLVRKQVVGERTNTTVTELDQTGRVEEVARMISGAEGTTEASVSYAQQMLLSSAKMREENEKWNEKGGEEKSNG